MGVGSCNARVGYIGNRGMWVMICSGSAILIGFRLGREIVLKQFVVVVDLIKNSVSLHLFVTI